MPTKTIIVILAVAALAAAGWYFRDTALLRGAASSVEGYVKNTLVDNSATVVKGKGAKSAGQDDPAKKSHALRKCVTESKTVYTDEACPPGSREAPISEGNVTVVPGQRAATKPKGEEKAK